MNSRHSLTWLGRDPGYLLCYGRYRVGEGIVMDRGSQRVWDDVTAGERTVRRHRRGRRSTT